MKYINKKNKSLKDSFYHAYEGICYTAIRERNMHIHIIMALLVILGGAIFQISYEEWLVCLILIALVISLELLNTAVESVVDLITTNDNPLAKVAKDCGSAAAFVSSIMVFIICCFIFIPKIIAIF